MNKPTRPPPPHLRTADGADAGAYTVLEPLTLEAVRARATYLRGLRTPSWASPVPDTSQDRRRLYIDVLRTIGADRGPLGDLARAALEAEEK